MNNNLMNRDENTDLFATVVNNTSSQPGASAPTGGNAPSGTTPNGPSKPTPFAITGFVLGILSLLPTATGLIGLEFLDGTWIIFLLLSVAGIIFSVLAKKRGDGTKLRTAGLVLSIIGTVLNGAVLVLVLNCAACIGCLTCTSLLAAV